MAKARQPNSTRRAPVPGESHAEIEAWLVRSMPDLQPILRWLDAQIRAEFSDLRYAIKWQKAYYAIPSQGWVIELVAYDVSVNVVFLGGADFASPPPLGTTDRSRYVKLRSLEEAQRPNLLAWIQQAGQVPGWAFDP